MWLSFNENPKLPTFGVDWQINTLDRSNALFGKDFQIIGKIRSYCPIFRMGWGVQDAMAWIPV
ncbi:MAG: hypothetical protein EB067_06965 [Actinobacteria bacterium]|nr:hypothetical protein [Actinomycetota bacterium]